MEMGDGGEGAYGLEEVCKGRQVVVEEMVVDVVNEDFAWAMGKVERRKTRRMEQGDMRES